MLTAHGRVWVPHNRWDLAPPDGGHPPRVAVVVPYFEQPDSLLRMYAALAATDRRSMAGLEIVVVDDGSRVAPPNPPSALDVPVRILRQPDRGCRPGAARNLGVAATEADVVVFLDPDTLPEPATVGCLARWPATVADAIVVGRRRHAQLGGWSAAAVTAWLTGSAPAPAVEPDPEWLSAGYRQHRNLLDADDRAYRFVISGVMACDRALFDDIGGFAPERDEYGGEDWELAARAFAAGAVLVHEPAAVAWHDEPDWSARADSDPTAKTTETMWLAERIPVSGSRGRGIRHAVSAAVITAALRGSDPLAAWVATLDTLVTELPDARVLLADDVPARIAAYVAADSRFVVRCDSPVRPPAPVTVAVHRPIEADPGAIAALVHEVVTTDLGRLDVTDEHALLLRVESTRACARARRAVAAGAATDEVAVVAELFGLRTVEAAAVGVRLLAADLDLAAWFSRNVTSATERDRPESARRLGGF